MTMRHNHPPASCWCGEKHTPGGVYDLNVHGRLFPPDVYDEAAAEGAQNTYCQDCNYGTHRCPGCGYPVAHGTPICGECTEL